MKSDSLRLSVTFPPCGAPGTARSTVAPLGIVPAFVALTWMREPSLPPAPKPLTTSEPCAIA